MTPSVLHIGYHKTASTWFQKHFYPNVRNFRYVDRLLVKEAYLYESAFRFDPAEARRRIGGGNGDLPLILSNEELVGNFHSGGLRGCFSAEIARRLRATFDEASIVVFIRSQPEMIASTYVQYVREGGTHSPDRFLFPGTFRRGQFREPYKLALWSFDHLDYGLLLERYAELFGRDNVHVFLYEAFRTDPVAFLQRYRERLGFVIDAELPTATSENVSYGSTALTLARVLNRFDYRRAIDKSVWVHLGTYKLRRWILNRLNGSRFAGSRVTPRTVLSESTLRYVFERYAEANRELARRWNLPLAEHGYPVDRSPPAAGREPRSSPAPAGVSGGSLITSR